MALVNLCSTIIYKNTEYAAATEESPSQLPKLFSGVELKENFGAPLTGKAAAAGNVITRPLLRTEEKYYVLLALQYYMKK